MAEEKKSFFDKIKKFIPFPVKEKSEEQTPVAMEEAPEVKAALDIITEPTPVEEEIRKEEPLPTKQEKSAAQSDDRPRGWFARLKDGLSRTRKTFVFKMKGLFRMRNVIDEEFWEELEEILLTADVGLETTKFIVDQMREAIDEHYISEPAHLFEVLKEKLIAVMEEKPAVLNLKEGDLSVIVVVGVNGTGKTTSIAKIANRLMLEGKTVMIAAADTFRAAAIEQLEIWAKKIGIEIIKHREGADPAAVVFDAITAAKARKADVLIIDTAGRLHSKVNLMKELEKINRVITRIIPDGPHETLLVLDATTGQNALIQAKTFSQSVTLSGLVLTKLDGTAKGGIIIGIVHELGIPVKFIGVGEGVLDLKQFDAKSFLEALFAEDDDASLETGKVG